MPGSGMAGLSGSATNFRIPAVKASPAQTSGHPSNPNVQIYDSLRVGTLPVIEPDSLTDQPLAVIDQQPQIQLGSLQLRRRQGGQAFAHRRSGDGDRVDAVGLPALTAAAPCAGHQPGRDTHNTFPALDQESLKRSRHMPAVLEPPDPLAI